MKKLITAIKILAVLFILIQFYPVEKPMVKSENKNDFISTNKVPENISKILKTSCYDCHSNETTFPWYSKVAPIKWLVYHDINEGREALNFSNWNALSNDDKSDALFDIADAIKEEEMPLNIYLYKHSEAKLSKAQREDLVSWFEGLAEEL